MNMFRNILTVVTLALGLGLWFLPLEDWRWVAVFGDDAMPWVEFFIKAEPFPTIILLTTTLALFMTRKQY